MHALFKVIALGLLLLLATACVAPPPSPEDAASYALYAQARATDAAAAEIIAAAKATEAAAGAQIARFTAEAASVSSAITTTVTPTPTVVITSTDPVTPSTVISPTIAASTILSDVLAAAGISATVQLIDTPAPTASVEVTSTLLVSPTVVATPTVTATMAVTPAGTPVATSTPSTAAVAAGWVWPGLPASGPASQPPAATPTATPASFGAAIVTSQQANVRGGPGTSFPVVTTARQGASLQVTGSNDDQSWWQVCCIDETAGWVSQSIVRFQGDRQAVPVVGPLMPDDLSATWELRWECHGSGCNQEECLGQSDANALRVVDDRWLEVAREASWPDGCGEPENWLTQVDRYTGKERQSAANATLFNIWEGVNPGPASQTVDLLDTQLSVWCTDTRTREVEQQDGWTVLYEGQACYDTEAGVLALMQYVKRWLFSGTVDGQTFDRQYFGDYEVYQQVLTSTNAPTSGQPAGPGD